MEIRRKTSHLEEVRIVKLNDDGKTEVLIEMGQGTAFPIRLRMRPAMSQISLRACAGGSESSLGAYAILLVAKDLNLLQSDSGNSDQTSRMLALI